MNDHPADVSNPTLHGAMTWKGKAQRLRTEAHVFFLVFKHLRTPWYARLVAACSVGYLFSPIQLIPSFIPVIGFFDDLLVLYLAAKVLWKITPPDVLAECRASAIGATTEKSGVANTKLLRKATARVGSAD